MKNRIYNLSPSFVQNILVTVQGYLNKRTRYGKYYYKERHFLKIFDKLSYEDKKSYQLNELNKLLAHAYQNSKFYKEEFDKKALIKPLYKLESIEEIKKLPVLEKDSLKNNLESIYTCDEVVSYTGGTTGKSMKVYYTERDIQRRMALLDHFKSKVGFENLKMWKASFTGKEIVPLEKDIVKKPYRVNLFNKQLLLSSFHLNDKNYQYYIDVLNFYKPQSIDGLYSSILGLAKFINKNKLTLNFQPKAVFPTAETITAVGRKEIETAFKARVYNQYASSEGAPFITECTEGKLHIEQVSGIFEVLDNEEVLVTSFTSYGTPLIRYRIGDSIKKDYSSRECTCGVVGDLAIEILGRTSNYITNERNQKITEANAANFFKELSYVDSGQIIKKGSKYIFNIVVNDKVKFKNNYQLLCKKIRAFVGSDEYSIEVNDKLKLESSGKFMIVKEVESVIK